MTHGAELSYNDSSGKPVKVAITLRTRGHFRRQARNCEFPPLKVEMAKAAAARTLFEGNRTLKLVTSCRPSNADYEQYVLQEYALYRIYQALTPWSYRTRLAHIAYRDSAGKAKPVDSWAFFVEDDGDLAQRRGSKKFQTTGAMFEHLEPTEFGYLQLFEYMSGNTDWSVSGLHNVTLMRDSDRPPPSRAVRLRLDRRGERPILVPGQVAPDQFGARPAVAWRLPHRRGHEAGHREVPRPASIHGFGVHFPRRHDAGGETEHARVLRRVLGDA